MRRLVLERWSAALGGCALGGVYFFYVVIFILPRDGTPDLDGVVRSVVNGGAQAPYQYRFLVPCIEVWLNDHAALSMGQAAMLVDMIAMAIAGAIGFAILKRVGLGLFALPAGLYCAYVGIGIAALSKPETVVAFACTTAALLALERRPVIAGWWSPYVVWSVLVVASVVLLGCRTDLVFALATGFAVRYRYFRARADAAAMVCLALAAVIVSVALVAHWPHSHYPKGTAVVQILHNLDALPLVVLSCFLLPALAPLVMMFRHPAVSLAVRPTAVAHLPLIVMILTEVSSTFIVGRIDEVRLAFPLAFAIAWVGVDLWRALFASLHLDESLLPLAGE